MVKEVEELSSEVNVLTLRNRERLQDSEISLADARPTALRPLGSAQCAQQTRLETAEHRSRAACWLRVIGRIFREAVRIKVIVSIRLWLQFSERRELCGLARQFKIEAVHLFIVRLRADSDGEA